MLRSHYSLSIIVSYRRLYITEITITDAEFGNMDESVKYESCYIFLEIGWNLENRACIPQLIQENNIILLLQMKSKNTQTLGRH